MNKNDSRAVFAVFNFGSRLPLPIDYAVYLVIALSALTASRQMARLVGDVIALAVYLVIGTLSLALWGFAWRHRVTVTSDGVTLFRGVRMRSRLIAYSELRGVLAFRSDMLEVELASGEKLQLARAHGKKGRAQLNQLLEILLTRAPLRAK